MKSLVSRGLHRLGRRLPVDLSQTPRDRACRGFSDGAGAGWDVASLQQALRQVGATGELEADYLLRLRGDVPTEKAQDEEAPEEPEELPGLKCSFSDMLQLADLCKSAGLQDFVGLGELADRSLCRLVEDGAVSSASASELLRLAGTFSILGVLHPPLFSSLTTSFLRLWPVDGAVSPGATELTRLARALAAQRAESRLVVGGWLQGGWRILLGL
eukprot:s1119_g10.t1